MTHTLLLLLLFLGLDSALQDQKALAASAPAVPDVIQSNISPRAAPLWISTQAATSGNGVLREDRFSPNERAFLEGHAEANRRARLDRGQPLRVPPQATPRAGIECPEVLGAPIVESLIPRPKGSLEELTRGSRQIFQGQVLRSRQGFFDGQPASLLQIRVESVLKSGTSDAPKVLLLAYPFARFALDGDTYCAGLPGTEPPSPGSRVLAFLFEDRSLDDSLQLYAPERDEIAFESPSGQLELPSRLLSGDALYGVTRLEQVTTAVKSILSDEAGNTHPRLGTLIVTREPSSAVSSPGTAR